VAAFVVIESRSRNLLLPLRIVTDRNRGASLASIAIAGAAILSLLLFLTYYRQQAEATRRSRPASRSCPWRPR
jgi:hypothetical protein